MFKTDVALCASYEDGANAKWLLKIPSSDAIMSWSKKTALFGVVPLASQPFLSG